MVYRRCGWDLGVVRTIIFIHEDSRLQAASWEFWPDFGDSETFWGAPHAQQLDELSNGVIAKRSRNPAGCTCGVSQQHACGTETPCMACVSAALSVGVYMLGASVASLWSARLPGGTFQCHSRCSCSVCSATLIATGQPLLPTGDLRQHSALCVCSTLVGMQVEMQVSCSDGNRGPAPSSACGDSIWILPQTLNDLPGLPSSSFVDQTSPPI